MNKKGTKLEKVWTWAEEEWDELVAQYEAGGKTPERVCGSAEEDVGEEDDLLREQLKQNYPNDNRLLEAIFLNL